jgi:hypothetical protein
VVGRRVGGGDGVGELEEGDTVGLGQVGRDIQLGRNAADGWASAEKFKRKLSWAAKAIGPNSRMGCRNSFQEFGCQIKGFK